MGFKDLFKRKKESKRFCVKQRILQIRFILKSIKPADWICVPIVTISKWIHNKKSVIRR